MSRAAVWSYYPGALSAGEEVALGAEEARHVAKSRRLSVGLPLTLTDGAGHIAQTCLSHVAGASEVRARIEHVENVPPPRPVTLACSLPKGDRQAALLEAATQLGATQIQPLNCEFTPPAARKINSDRAGRILISAIKQAHRAWLPEFLPMDTPSALIERATDCIHLLADRRGGSVAEALSEPTVALWLWVGPEGGFSEAERDFLTQAGARPVCLGPHILRIETAATVLLGLVGDA